MTFNKKQQLRDVLKNRCFRKCGQYPGKVLERMFLGVVLKMGSFHNNQV